MAATTLDGRLPFALSWTINEPMERSSHALVDGGGVWLIDPVANEEALAAAEGRGEIVAVLQLLDRHRRDTRAVAERYGVERLRLPDRIPDSPFRVQPMVSTRGWRELVLLWPERSLAVIPEAVGSASYFAVGGRPLGMHPFLRMNPPKALRDLEAERLLVGHGPPLHQGGTEALAEALDRSRRDAARAAVAGIRAFTPGLH